MARQFLDKFNAACKRCGFVRGVADPENPPPLCEDCRVTACQGEFNAHGAKRNGPKMTVSVEEMMALWRSERELA